MSKFYSGYDFQYMDLLEQTYLYGFDVDGRNGKVREDFSAAKTTVDLRKEFPLLQIKKTNLSTIAKETIFFVRGQTNNNILKEQGVKIWNKWERENGDLGPIYGSQWRNFNGQGYDQLQNAIETIRNNPNSRRIIVSAWNPCQLDDMALPPCHIMFQFNVQGEDLDLLLFQRSSDILIGTPFNDASYSLLLHMVAHLTNKRPRKFIHVHGNTHIYHNQFPVMDKVQEQFDKFLKEYVERRRNECGEETNSDTDPESYSRVQLVKHEDFYKVENINDFEPYMFEVENYNPQPFIKIPVSE